MSLIDAMQRLSAAEDFFALLDLPYSPEVMHRARLHVLKRMGQMLAGGALAGLDEEAAREKARAILRAAHDEFLAAPAIEKRLFKVLAERDPKAAKKRGAFVPLSAIAPLGSA
jgi:nitrogenase-stabilizing/protective protein